MPTPRFGESEVARALGVQTVSLLGVGTFGDTWKADNKAIKIICIDGYPPDRVAREVGGLTRVSSANVVRLLGTGTIQLGGKQRTTLIFEYVDGGDLEARFNSSIRPSEPEVRDLLVGMLRGVRDLHAADGTIHRDIKPANVALAGGQWDRPVILDLGLAKSIGDTTLTVYPAQVGTVLYMAPEQLEGRRARKACDLFATGATVRAVANGVHPFWDSSLNTHDELRNRIVAGPRPMIQSYAPELERVLDLLVSPAEHDRGSANSNLRRLGAA